MPSVRRFATIATVCAAAALASACGGSQVPQEARTTVISIDKLDCGGCGDELAEKLGKQDGVYKASFDKRRAELTVVASPGVDVLSSAKRHQGDEEYVLVLGAGKGTYLAWATPPEGADVATLSKDGADVPALEPHLAKGKVTVMDFSASWCEPCRALDEHVLEVVGKRQDVAYRKLDVGDWDTPLAQRYLKGIANLPYVIVYDKNGQKVDAISGLDLKRLDAAIDKGSR
jgi:thiol-disulfide isomerase/thioredoxin